MIRFVTLSLVAALLLMVVLGSGTVGAFGGVALLAVGVAGFGLCIGLCMELLRHA
jgi:hypothetical protein